MPKLDLSPVTEEEKKWIEDQKPSLARRGLDVIVKAAETYDAYTGAPSRSAISAGIAGESPLAAFYEQFGEREKKAPTGREVAVQMGISDQPRMVGGRPPLYDFSGERVIKKAAIPGKMPGATDAQVAGLAIDMLADPLLVAGPAFRAARGVSTGLGRFAEIVGTKYPAVKTVAQEGTRIAAKAGEAVSELHTEVMAKGGQKLAAVPEDVTRAYIKDRPGVKGVIQASGNDIQVAANNARELWGFKIKQARAENSRQIEEILKNTSTEQKIDITPIVNTLKNRRNHLDPFVESDEIAKLDEMINAISGGSQPEMLGTPMIVGKQTVKRYKAAEQLGQLRLGETPPKPGIFVNAKQLNARKKYLYKQADFMRGGQFVQPRTTAAEHAATAASLQAKELLESVVPSIKGPNSRFHRLYNVQEEMHRNLLAPGQPANLIVTAGSGSNRHRDFLKELSDIVNETADASKEAAKRMTGDIQGSYKLLDTGEELLTPVDFVQDARRVAAQQYFGKLELLPMDSTGKSIGRTIFVATIIKGVNAFLHAAGVSGKMTDAAIGAIATGLTSPAMLRTAIDAGHISMDLARKLGSRAKTAATMTPEEYQRVLITGRSAEGIRIISEHLKEQALKQEELEKAGESPALRRLKK